MRFLTTFVALACATFGFSQLANQNAYGAPVDWRTVAEGSNSRILTAGQVVITSPIIWQSYFSQMVGDRNVGDTPAPLLCNFGTQDLIVVHMGQKPTTGYRTFVTSIERPRIGVKQVNIISMSPPPNAVLAQQMVSPYVVIVANKASGQYDFKWTPAIYNQLSVFGGGGNTCGCTCPCCASGHCHGGHLGGNGGGIVINGNTGQIITGGTQGNRYPDICPPLPSVPPAPRRNGGN